MKEELISIIIPVYNVENYLRKCLDSVICQTYKKLEIIVVNDGSKDDSLSIIKEYKKKDDRLFIIDKENGGLSSARNAGMEKASGKYLFFLDSDDFIELDMIETLYNDIKRTGKQIAIGNRYYYYEDGTKKIRFDESLGILEFDKITSIEKLVNLTHFDMSAWGKLYDANLFKDIVFPIGKLSEDYYIMYLIFSRSNGVVYNSKPMLYYLQQRKGSITKNSKLILDYIYAAKEQMEYININYPKIANDAKSAYCLSYFTVYNKVISNGGKVEKKFIIEMKDNTKKFKKYVYSNKHISKSKKLQLFIFLHLRIFYNFILKVYKKLGV